MSHGDRNPASKAREREREGVRNNYISNYILVLYGNTTR
jgi:hypothetical protein